MVLAWTPTNLETLPSSVLMGVIVSRFQNGVPSRLHAMHAPYFYTGPVQSLAVLQARYPAQYEVPHVQLEAKTIPLGAPPLCSMPLLLHACRMGG